MIRMIKKCSLICLLFFQCGNSNDNFDKNHDTIIEYLKENGTPDFILNIYKKYADDDVKKIGDIIGPEKRNGNKFQFKDGLIQEKNNDEILNIYNIDDNNLKILCKYYKTKIKVNVQYKDIKDEVTIDTTTACAHKGTNDDKLLKILYLLSTDENRIKKINNPLFKNDFNNVKHLLYAIDAKSCCSNDKIICNFSETSLRSSFNPLLTLEKFNKELKSDKLVIGQLFTSYPSNDMTICKLIAFINDKSKSDKDKEQCIEKVIKTIKNTNSAFKLVDLMQIIFFGHAMTYIYFPDIKKILVIDSENHFDFCNEFKQDDNNAIYISSSDLLKIQNGLNCLTCATLNICLLSEYLSKDNNHEKLKSIMKDSSQKNKSELVKFMKNMFNTKNAILKKCVDLNYTEVDF